MPSSWLFGVKTDLAMFRVRGRWTGLGGRAVGPLMPKRFWRGFSRGVRFCSGVGINRRPGEFSVAVGSNSALDSNAGSSDGSDLATVVEEVAVAAVWAAPALRS